MDESGFHGVVWYGRVVLDWESILCSVKLDAASRSCSVV